LLAGSQAQEKAEGRTTEVADVTSQEGVTLGNVRLRKRADTLELVFSAPAAAQGQGTVEVTDAQWNRIWSYGVREDTSEQEAAPAEEAPTPIEEETASPAEPSTEMPVPEAEPAPEVPEEPATEATEAPTDVEPEEPTRRNRSRS
jgi:hypothetical protein